MGARTADWHLLDYATDPVPNEGADLDGAIKHYKEISSALSTQAVLLRKIGDGDETLLKGVSADAMRKRARDSSEALGKAATRYEQTRVAITSYRTDLETARSETAIAVADATDASLGKRSADNLPDPVGDTRATDAPPPTPEEDRQSQARTRAIEKTGADLVAAKSRAERAMTAFGEAAARAAAAIRHGWDVDGLHTSGGDAFLHVLNKILKKLVEVLGWIGLALAIVGLVISGVGIIAVMGLVIAALSLVINIILAAQGETSWLNVILGVVGLVFIGFGAIATKVLKAGQTASLKLGSQALTRDMSRLYARIGWIRTGGPGGGSPAALTESRVAALRAFQTFADGKKVKPAWWNVKHPDYLQVNKDKFTDIAGKWRWDKVLGIDDAVDLNTINRTIFETFRAGSTAGVPTWLFVGGAAKAWGWTAGVFGGIANPSTYPGDERTQWSWADAVYAGPTSDRPL